MIITLHYMYLPQQDTGCPSTRKCDENHCLQM